VKGKYLIKLILSISMALKNQFQKLKENWLLLALVVVVLVVFSGLNPTQTFTNKIAMDESVDLTASRSSSFVPYYDNFAPEAAQRFITKTSSLSTEIKRNTFQETDSKVKDLTKGFNAIIINENQNKNGEGKTSYLSSSYTMKVETSKYDSLVSQLKTIGEITYFNENSDDITEQKLDLQTSLEAERERLARYKQLLETAQTTQEKIELTDKIFDCVIVPVNTTSTASITPLEFNLQPDTPCLKFGD